MKLWCCAVLSLTVMSDSWRPHALQPTRLLIHWVFSRQVYWSGLPCPPPGALPTPGIEPRPLTLQVDSLPSEPPGKFKNTGPGNEIVVEWFNLQVWNLLLLILESSLTVYQESKKVPMTFVPGISPLGIYPKKMIHKQEKIYMY